MSVTTTPLPSASEVLISTEKRLQAMVEKHIQDTNSPLAKLFEGRREFSTENELRAYLQDCLSNMWDSLEWSMLDLGFPTNPDQYRSQGKKEWQEYMRRFTEGIFSMLVPALENINGKFVLDLSIPDNVSKILSSIQQGASNTKYGNPLSPWQDNSIENASLTHLRSAMTILPATLRTHISEESFTAPVNSKHKVHEDAKLTKVAKTGVMTATVLFMTYGIHWLMNTTVTKLAEMQSNPLDNIFSDMLQSNVAYPMWSWLLAAAAGYSVGSALLYPAKKLREKLIELSESGEILSGKKMLWALAIGAPALLVPLTFGAVDAAGIFNREAEGYIVWYIAHETKAKLGEILDIKSPNSPVGKASLQYDANTNTLTVFSNDFVSSELKRANAGWRWPAAVAKEFILKWDLVLSDPTLSRDTGLLNAVQKASTGLNAVNKQNHIDYPWLPDKAKRVQTFFGQRTDSLVNGYIDAQTGQKFAGIASFDPMIEMNKHGPLYHFIWQIPGLGHKIYKSHDLALLQWKFATEAKEYQEALSTVNKSWGERSQVYQTYIQEVSAIADAKYKSRTTVTIPSSIPTPDLSALDSALKAKPPEIKALWPQASYEKLKEIKWKPGGIAESDLDTLVTFSIIRPFAFEFTSLVLIISALMAMFAYYRNPKNKLSGKKEDLNRAYNALVRAVQKTFSWDMWQSIFPWHPGIDEQEAEFIVREIATDIHPELLDFFPSVHQNSSWTKKFAHSIITTMKNIHQWVTRSRDEKYVISLAKALEKMWLKSTGNIGINTNTIQKIFQKVIPAQYLKGHNMTEEELWQITHEIEQNLQNLTADKEASYAIESRKFKNEYEKRLSTALSKIEQIEVSILPQLSTWLVSASINNETKTQFSILTTRIQTLRSLYETVQAKEFRVGREIGLIESEIQAISTEAAKFKIKM